MIVTVSSFGCLVNREINMLLYENKMNGDVNYDNFLSNYRNVFIDTDSNIYWDIIPNNMATRRIKRL